MPIIADGTVPDSVSLHNPYNFKVILQTGAIDATFTTYTGHARMHQAISAPMEVLNTLSLPSLDTSLGFDEPPDMGTLEYDAGALSIHPVGGALFYIYDLYENDEKVGSILSDSNSTVLPSWITSSLYGKLIDIEFQVIDVNLAGIGPEIIQALGQGTSPINVKTGLIVQDLGGGNYDTHYQGQVQF
jgi:hypothetical protein